MNVTVVFTGRSYHQANRIPDQLSVPPNATLEDAIRVLQEALPADQTLPSSCLVTVSGKHVGTVGNYPPHALTEGDELVLIAPVAGG